MAESNKRFHKKIDFFKDNLVDMVMDIEIGKDYRLQMGLYRAAYDINRCPLYLCIRTVKRTPTGVEKSGMRPQFIPAAFTYDVHHALGRLLTRHKARLTKLRKDTIIKLYGSES